MPPRIFFSFHYQRDIWRANQVRNSWIVRGGETEGRFEDVSLWEDAQTKGESAIRKLIDGGLEHSDATVVLVGQETAQRPWVRYEIEQSWLRNNAIIGIYINRLRDQGRAWHARGPNPFSRIRYEGNKTLGQVIPIYDWQQDSGYDNLVEWLKDAPRRSEVERGGTTPGQLIAGGAAIVLGALALKKIFGGRQWPPGYR